jgi:hypothetical protein
MKIHIRTTNAAFEGDKTPELARILRKLADDLERQGVPERGEVRKLFDVNGNTVGTVRP